MPTCRVMIDFFLHKSFARFDIPETIVSDISTQFSSKEFENFCKIHSIVYWTSPPYHSMSNGMAERFVDVFKRAIKASGLKTANKVL